MATARRRTVEPGERCGDRDRPVLRLLGAEAAAELAGHVGTARELVRRREERRRDAFPTGVEPVDRLLRGGLPRGTLVELVGRPGSGRFATALGILARATRAGEAAALVDLGDHLDPRSALALDTPLERLLWVRPGHLRQALAAAETLLNGGFPLVVVDLGTPPVPGGRGQEAGWVRLARAAQAHGAALLVSSPYRVSGTAAHAVIEARPERPAWTAAPAGSRRTAPPLLAGATVGWTLEKSRGRNGGDREEGRFLLPDAVAAMPPETRPETASGFRSAAAPGEEVPATKDPGSKTRRAGDPHRRPPRRAPRPATAPARTGDADAAAGPAAEIPDGAGPPPPDPGTNPFSPSWHRPPAPAEEPSAPVAG